MSATFDHPKTTCPTCGYVMDRATLLENYNPPEPPEPGDISVCAKCGEITVFEDDLSLRLMDLDDALEMPDNVMQTLIKAQTFIRRNRPLEKKNDKEKA